MTRCFVAMRAGVVCVCVCVRVCECVSVFVVIVEVVEVVVEVVECTQLWAAQGVQARPMSTTLPSHHSTPILHPIYRTI